jgi:hypothetical protein
MTETPYYLNGTLVNFDQRKHINVTFRRSCNACTRKRKSCDATKPKCARCEKAGEDCVYSVDKTHFKRDQNPAWTTKFPTVFPIPDKDTSTADAMPNVQIVFPNTINLPSKSRDLSGIVNAYDVSFAPAIPLNQAQLECSKHPSSCDELTVRWLTCFVEYLPPGLTLFPWSTLPYDPVYTPLLETFLQRPLDTESIFFKPTPLHLLKPFLIDFYSYFEHAIRRVRQYGLLAPANDVSHLRAEIILALLAALLFINNGDTDQVDSKETTSNFDRILPDLMFRYLRQLGVDANYIDLGPGWRMADVFFVRRVWFLWNSVDIKFALMAYRKPLAVVRVQSSGTMADAISHAAGMKATTLSLLRSDTVSNSYPENLTPLGHLWKTGERFFVEAYATSLSLSEVMGQVLDWRMDERRHGFPMDVDSPLHPDNVHRKFYEAVINQWAFGDETAWVLGLEPGNVEYHGTTVEESRGMEEVFEMEKNWTAAGKQSGVITALLMRLHAGQFVVHPLSEFWTVMHLMMKTRAEGMLVNVSAEKVVFVLHRHVTLIMEVCQIWSRLLFLQNVGMKYKLNFPENTFLTHSFMDRVSSVAMFRETILLNLGMFLQLINMIRMANQTFSEDVYEFIVQDGSTVLLKQHGEITAPDLSDYTNIANYEFANEILLVIGQFHGDGEAIMDEHVKNCMTKAACVFTILLRVMKFHHDSGHERVKYAMELVETWLTRSPESSRLALNTMCQSWMELPLV